MARRIVIAAALMTALVIPSLHAQAPRPELARRTTESTLERYRAGEVTLVDLLQTIDREASTAGNFLQAFMGYQQTLRQLKEQTYYDFEYNMPLVERFAVTAGTEATPATPEPK